MIGEYIYESTLILRLEECLYSSCWECCECCIVRSKYCKWSCWLECIYESCCLHCCNYSCNIARSNSIIYDILRSNHHLSSYHYCIALESEDEHFNTDILRESTTISIYSCECCELDSIAFPAVTVVRSNAIDWLFWVVHFHHRFFHRHWSLHLHHGVRPHHHRSIHRCHRKTLNSGYEDCSCNSKCDNTFHIIKS